MKKRALLLILAAGLSANAWAAQAKNAAKGPEDAGQLFWQDKVLEAELPLAKSDSIYFVINADEGRVLFKAKGVVLREWKMASFRGRPPAWPVLATQLLKKEAQSSPKRKLIDPKNPKTAEEIGSYELDTLESKDMPAEFILTFENDIKINVVSGNEKPLHFLAHWKLSLDKAIYEQARDLWWMAFKPNARMFKAKFDDPKDAKTLCWSLTSGMRGLIIFRFDIKH